jgi:hypothetical protein
MDLSTAIDNLEKDEAIRPNQASYLREQAFKGNNITGILLTLAQLHVLTKAGKIPVIIFDKLQAKVAGGIPIGDAFDAAARENSPATNYSLREHKPIVMAALREMNDKQNAAVDALLEIKREPPVDN